MSDHRGGGGEDDMRSINRQISPPPSGEMITREGENMVVIILVLLG